MRNRILVACMLPLMSCAQVAPHIPAVLDGMAQLNRLIQDYQLLDPSAGEPVMVCEHEVTPSTSTSGGEIDMLCSAVFPK